MVTSIIRGREKNFFDTWGRKKVIWARGRRKEMGPGPRAEGRGLEAEKM